MLVSDRLIYLELQKTATTHIAETLESVVGGETEPWNTHTPLPRSFDPSNWTIVGSIRNPWDWYVSLWAFGCAGHGGIYNNLTRREPLRVVSQAFRHPSRMAQSVRHELLKPTDEWSRLYSDPDDPALFREWLHRLLETDYGYAAREGYAPNHISRFAGLFTFRYVRMTTEKRWTFQGFSAPKTLGELKSFDAEHNIWDEAIRVEHLEEDLIEVLRSNGYELGEEREEAIRQRSATNTSQRREASYYYDRRSSDLVRLRDELIVEKYGYTPP